MKNKYLEMANERATHEPDKSADLPVYTGEERTVGEKEALARNLAMIRESVKGNLRSLNGRSEEEIEKLTQQIVAEIEAQASASLRKSNGDQRGMLERHEIDLESLQ